MTVNIRQIMWIVGAQISVAVSVLIGVHHVSEIGFDHVVRFLGAEGAWLIGWATYSFKEEPLGAPR